MAQKDNHISWKAPEFEHHPKTPEWYWASIIISLVLLIVALWQGNLLFALFILIAETMIFNWGNQAPRVFEFALTDKGLWIGQKFHAYAELAHFSVLEQEDRKTSEIIVHKKTKVSHPVRIPIHTYLLPEARTMLANYLPHEEYDEPLPDALFRLIKF